jgi:hypothetical protein
MVSGDNDVRAEEIIVTIFKQRNEMVKQNCSPQKVIMSLENYKKIQDYRAGLGSLDNDEMDYIKKYSIFGLAVYIDNSEFVRVV